MKRAFLAVGTGQLLSASTQAVFVFLVLRTAEMNEFATYTLAISAFYVATSVSSSAFQRAYFIEYESIVLPYGRAAFLTAQILLGLGVLLGLQLIAPFGVGLGILTAVYVTTSLIYESNRWELQRKERFASYSFATVAQNALNLSMVLLAILLSIKLTASFLVITQVLSRLILIAGMTATRPWRSQCQSFASPIGAFRALLAKGYAILAIFHWLDGLLSQFAVLLLARLATPFELGSYGAALRLVGVTAVAVATARGVLLPILGKTNSSADVDGRRSSYRSISAALTAFILLVALGSSIWVPIIDGGKFKQSVSVFQLLSLSTVFNLWAVFDVTLLIKRHCHRHLCLYALVGLFANAAISIVLIPHYGAVGAAIGTVTGLFVFCMLVTKHGKNLKLDPVPC